MMGKTSVKIRGIYSTALTSLLLENGYAIVRPSPAIQERFQLKKKVGFEDISIWDREDHQGVRIMGLSNRFDQLLSLFKSQFFDAAVRSPSAGDFPLKGEEEFFGEIEFPWASKATLDSLRGRITSTIRGHHLLKTIASEWVELVEDQILSSPFRKEELEKGLRERVIYGPLRQCELVKIIHVRPEGEEFSLRGGKIISLEKNHLVIRREFSGGTGYYDGLNLPIEEGDYGITEASEGDWFLKHTYYSRSGLIKGTYWNINTPIEFYPDHIRYLDLHIDMVQRSGSDQYLIDQGKLTEAVAKGFISQKLAQKAFEVANHLR